MNKLVEWIDKKVDASSRAIARRSGRRSFLGRLGSLAVGASTLPLLPVARASAAEGLTEIGDTQSCEYWRYCALGGTLCTCCGGTTTSCPPGAEPSPISWVGTCKNPVDGKDYLISYNDCCGKSGCGNCLCNRNEGDRPMYTPPKSNDINWCLGTQSAIYHCSTAIVVGLAVE